ncbi:hypothetical protein ABW21_db0200996 [Orbilia brochopaga]|nr:hypothetical protein ABW21_db0200996 [Drechslerella brochopaga]
MKLSAIFVAAVALVSSAEATAPKPAPKPAAPMKCDNKCLMMPCLQSWCKAKGYFGQQNVYFTVTAPAAAAKTVTVTVTETVGRGRGGNGDRTKTITKQWGRPKKSDPEDDDDEY